MPREIADSVLVGRIVSDDDAPICAPSRRLAWPVPVEEAPLSAIGPNFGPGYRTALSDAARLADVCRSGARAIALPLGLGSKGFTEAARHMRGERYIQQTGCEKPPAHQAGTPDGLDSSFSTSAMTSRAVWYR
jgi:hypothetical protein